jgi:acyl carrier protein
MIKSRGYRVELGEIETVLYRHEQVKEAVAVAIPDELLGSRIRCYVALAEGAVVTGKELEAFCVKFLPKYMVPERIEVRDVLPKTSSGKVDRTALLAAPASAPAPAPALRLRHSPDCLNPLRKPHKPRPMNIQAEIEKFILEDLLSGSRSSIAADEQLFSTGTLDSLGTLRLITFLEERFGLQIKDGELGDDNFATVNNIKAFVEKKLAAG